MPGLPPGLPRFSVREIGVLFSTDFSPKNDKMK
jgi:hypothetical protein